MYNAVSSVYCALPFDTQTVPYPLNTQTDRHADTHRGMSSLEALIQAAQYLEENSRKFVAMEMALAVSVAHKDRIK